MADEDKQRQTAARGAQAAQVLENPLVVEAMTALEAMHTERSKKRNQTPDEVFTEYCQHQGRLEFIRYFTAIINRGKEAAHQLATQREAERKQRERAQ